jgi:hypothetical protein
MADCHQLCPQYISGALQFQRTRGCKLSCQPQLARPRGGSQDLAKGTINLHGHSDGRLKPLPPQTDVGVDVRDFLPVRLTEIIQRSARGREDSS